MDTNTTKKNHRPLPVIWRPRSLDDVKGQEAAKELISAVLKQQDHTPLLFVGPAGTGKTTLARIVAAHFNCEHPLENGPCCTCTSCQEIAADRSLNVVELDGAKNSGKADVDNLLRGINFVPLGNVRFLIIDECHILTKDAWAMLLKVVEEPPEGVVFAFCTTDPGKVPVAIKTRCRIIKLNRISNDVIVDRLIEICKANNQDYELDALRIIVKSAEGSMRDAITKLGLYLAIGDVSVKKVVSVEGVPNEEHIFDLLRSVAEGKLADAMDAIERLDTEGKPADSVIKECQQVLKDVLYVQYKGDLGQLIATDDYRNGIMNVAGFFDPISARRVFRAISENIPKTKLELQQLVITSITMEDDISVLYERINSLETQLSDLRSVVSKGIVNKQPESSVPAVSRLNTSVSEESFSDCPDESTPFHDADSSLCVAQELSADEMIPQSEDDFGPIEDFVDIPGDYKTEPCGSMSVTISSENNSLKSILGEDARIGSSVVVKATDYSDSSERNIPQSVSSKEGADADSVSTVSSGGNSLTAILGDDAKIESSVVINSAESSDSAETAREVASPTLKPNDLQSDDVSTKEDLAEDDGLSGAAGFLGWL